MEDPPCVTVSGEEIPRETECRRAAWRPGRLVVLSDGQSWCIPPITANGLGLDPKLLAHIGLAFDLARAVRPNEPESAGQTRTLVRYHARLAQVALILLRINYELSDDQWRRLFAFPSLAEMIRLTLSISQEAADTITVWRPLHNQAQAQARILARPRGKRRHR